MVKQSTQHNNQRHVVSVVAYAREGAQFTNQLPCCVWRCLLQVRAHVEAQINLVAAGQARKESVVNHTVEQFKAKFAFFVGHIARMDSLFEANFSPLASSGELQLAGLRFETFRCCLYF